MNNVLAGIFSTLAPTVASALLGPLGGVAVAAISKILGIGDGKVESISKAFTEGKITPDHLAEIKKLELQYQNDELERGFKYKELEFKDIASARSMQVATNSLTPTVLTYMITVGFFGILGWMLHDDTVVNSPPLLIMLGSLGTAWTGAVSFWFGSTAGSARTRELLGQSAPVK
jgi:hypothetical protein